jgi:hypothetical protein
LGGADRFATNAEVLGHFGTSWDLSNGVFAANGTDSFLVDALAV